MNYCARMFINFPQAGYQGTPATMSKKRIPN